MKLEETSIYPYIKAFPDLHKLYRIPAGCGCITNK